MSRREAKLPAPPPRLHRSALGRADLLRLLGGGQFDPLDAAFLCGYEPLAQQPAAGAATALPPQSRFGTPSAVSASPRRQALQAVHFIVDVQSIAAEEQQMPELHEGAVLDDVPLADPQCRAPVPQRLVQRRRMASLARRCLRRPALSAQLDVDRWLRLAARAAPLPQRLPLKMLRRWSDASCLVVNGQAMAEPIGDDLHELVHDVMAWSAGAAGVYWIDEGGQWLQATGSARHWRWREVPASALRRARDLLLAGVSMQPAGSNGSDWVRRIAAVLRERGNVVWLRACASAAVPLVPAALRVVRWDQGAPLRLESSRTARQQTALPALPRLLAAMSMAVRVEPALLRAMRVELGLPIAAEVEAWSHPDVQSYGLACVVRPECVAQHRERARNDLHAATRTRIAGLIAAQHRHLSPLIQMEESAIAADLAPAPQRDAAAEDQWLRAARTLAQRPDSLAAQAVARYVARTAERAHPGMWRTSGLAAAWVLARRQAPRSGQDLPAGLPVALVQGLLQERGTGEPCSIVQRRGALWLVAGEKRNSLAVLRGGGAGVVIEADGAGRWHAPQGGDVHITTGGGPWVVHAGLQRVLVSQPRRPRWAAEWGRDAQGLYALTPSLADWSKRIDVTAEHTLSRWLGPTRRTSRDSTLRIGVDEYGAWVDLQLAGQLQRFRWLPPGEFMMGSSDEERARISDKRWRETCMDESPRHVVRLTQGLWLADTACTQALWRAVMHGNPSRFDDDPLCPVEQVSHDDVLGFLAAIQPALPVGVQAVLPTEAEWEYACRAGTYTAYSFGDTVSREQANVDDLEDFGAGNRGGSTGHTVRVRSLPANDWGYFEMHGNVWEWCADGLRRYEGEAVDPRGPVEQGPEAHRALRGGSWFSGVWCARSAYRLKIRRDDRFDFLGFRFALRSSGTSSLRAAERPGEPEASAVARWVAGPASNPAHWALQAAQRKPR